MKTRSQTTRPFPKPAKFSLYLGAVVILSFFNWVALQAQDPTGSIENPLAAAVVEEEAEIQLENWMLNVSDEYMVDAEPEINLEPWMLTLSDEYLADAEPQIILEPWMLVFSDDFRADKEPELDIEPWMLSFSDGFLASGESKMTVEEWMTDTFLWDTAFMLAKK